MPTRDDYVRSTPDHVIDRAVEIWCRALHNPHHDNGDDSFIGAVGRYMTDSLTRLETSKPSYGDAIERFRGFLVDDLKRLRDLHGQPIPESERGGEKYAPTVHLFPNYLDCDYGPCTTLAIAADKAGLSHRVFSIKSSVHIYRDHVSSSFGYRSPHTHHYPLPNGDWLLTDLTGDDITKVVEYVMGGTPEFAVERKRSAVPAS